MNTTTAAAEAHATVATIRTWCRIGAVAALKTAGRWVIDSVSLARRIAIGAMRTTRKEAAVTEELPPISERRAARAAAKLDAEAARERIMAGLTLPALSGSDRQIAWATQLRLSMIRSALQYLAGSRHGVIYRLQGAGDDPLHTFIVGLLPGEGGYGSEAALTETLTTAITLTDGRYIHGRTGDRTTASWWIDNRRP